MRGTVEGVIRSMAETGDAIPATELSLMRKDGSRVPVFSSHVIVQVPDRERELFCIGIDLTEQREWAKQVTELNETLDKRVKERTSQLELALREQEAFSYSVSHDLRSPLRHINSYLAILEEDFGAELSQEARSYMERARSASAMMGKLIDELLEFSRIGRTELVKETVDLSKMVTGIVEALKANEPARDIKAVIAPGLTATGDKLLLNLVLENLLGNAWKYSSREKQFRLEFGSDVVNGESLFYIKDNGIGFQMEYHDKIFGVSQRLHGKEYDGTGIGLATVQRIIERHGGTVWARAELDRGSAFYFKLPETKVYGD
jgi:light-regulated signal transduction histidine kinase (bacteriophytochrome)